MLKTTPYTQVEATYLKAASAILHKNIEAGTFKLQALSLDL